MKSERQLEIIIYLLSHNTATAKELSEKFDVSVRTITNGVSLSLLKFNATAPFLFLYILLYIYKEPALSAHSRYVVYFRFSFSAH